MSQGAHFAHGATGGRLSGQRLRAIAFFPKVAAEEMYGVDQIVDGGSLCVLVHAHTPQAGNLSLAVGKQVSQHAQLLRRQAANLCRAFNGIR